LANTTDSGGPNIWIAVATVAAAIAAVFSAYAAIEANATAQKSEVRQLLVTYLATYRETMKDLGLDALSSVAAYKALKKEQKEQVKIVDGLLVSVVDAMYESSDSRADVWAGFIKAIPGPLADGYPLEDYATNRKTITAIKQATNAILKSEK
jgi:hypothetical protein